MKAKCWEKDLGVLAVLEGYSWCSDSLLISLQAEYSFSAVMLLLQKWTEQRKIDVSLLSTESTRGYSAMWKEGG